MVENVSRFINNREQQVLSAKPLQILGVFPLRKLRGKMRAQRTILILAGNAEDRVRSLPTSLVAVVDGLDIENQVAPVAEDAESDEAGEPRA